MYIQDKNWRKTWQEKPNLKNIQFLPNSDLEKLTIFTPQKRFDIRNLTNLKSLTFIVNHDHTSLLTKLGTHKYIMNLMPEQLEEIFFFTHRAYHRKYFELAPSQINAYLSKFKNLRKIQDKTRY